MFGNLREKIGKAMYGRYGTDAFSQFLLYVAVACVILSVFIKSSIWSVLMWGSLIYSYFRIFSKNHQKRFEENQKFLAAKAQFLGWFRKEKSLMAQRKEFHIYKCPGCRQKIRIPRGKGKIVVRCPKCQREFTKRS